jgi:hypothetical protein
LKVTQTLDYTFSLLHCKKNPKNVGMFFAALLEMTVVMNGPISAFGIMADYGLVSVLSPRLSGQQA